MGCSGAVTSVACTLADSSRVWSAGKAAERVLNKELPKCFPKNAMRGGYEAKDGGQDAMSGRGRTWRLKMGVVIVSARVSSPEWMALMMARV